MGSYDGAEICELVGIYILSRLWTIIDKKDCDLYKDDGLLVLRNVNVQQMDRVKDIGFFIDIVTNLKIVNFLNITFNLRNVLFKPYKKPNDSVLYKKKFKPPATNNKNSCVRSSVTNFQKINLSF